MNAYAKLILEKDRCDMEENDMKRLKINYIQSIKKLVWIIKLER